MDRRRLFNVLVATVVGLSVLSTTTAAFSLMPNEEAVHALLFGVWHGGSAGFALGLYYVLARRRREEKPKNLD